MINDITLKNVAILITRVIKDVDQFYQQLFLNEEHLKRYKEKMVGVVIEQKMREMKQVQFLLTKLESVKS